VPCHTCLLAGRSPQRSGFKLRLVYMGFVVDTVTVEEVFSEHIRCPLSVIFYQPSTTIIYLYTYLLIHSSTIEAV